MVLTLSFGHTLYKNYSDSDFNFVSKSVSDFNSESESDSEPDSNSTFMNLDICIFLLYICILLNKLADNFFLSIFITESIVLLAMQV